MAYLIQESRHRASAKESASSFSRRCCWTRFADEKMYKLVRQNKGGTFHLSVIGHEMIGAVCALALNPGKDWGLPYYRDRAFAIGIGCSSTRSSRRLPCPCRAPPFGWEDDARALLPQRAPHPLPIQLRRLPIFTSSRRR